LVLDDKGNRKEKIEYPPGCKGCKSTLEFDCTMCLYRENSWKYDEIKKLHVLAKWKEAGVDLNKIEPALHPETYLKIKLVQDIIK